MKSLFVLALALVSTSAFAFGSPLVNGARYNAANQSIDVDVTYGGGCEEHKFKLDIGMCLESFPVQCEAIVFDVSEKPDFCEALVSKTVSFKLADYGLNDGYYTGASISIGAEGLEERFTIRLPRQ
jgi:hypothetical protein